MARGHPWMDSTGCLYAGTCVSPGPVSGIVSRLAKFVFLQQAKRVKISGKWVCS